MNLSIRIILPDNILKFIQAGVSVPENVRFHPGVFRHIQTTPILKHNLVELVEKFQQTGPDRKVEGQGISFPGERNDAFLFTEYLQHGQKRTYAFIAYSVHK